MRTLALTASLLLLIAVGSALGGFSGSINGTVVTGAGETPLKDVRLSVEIHGTMKDNADETDADGYFDIDLLTLFEGLSLTGKSICLVFSKKGYQDVVSILTPRSADPVECINMKVQMVPFVGSSAISPHESVKLDPYRSSEGRTLFLLPYKVRRVPKAGKVMHIDLDMLAEALHLAIVTHLQALPIFGPSLYGISWLFDISIQPISIEVVGTNIEKIRAYGLYLNALAMISGSVSVRDEEFGKELVRVFSRYTVTRFLRECPTRTVCVTDIVPIDSLNSPEVYERLSKLWGFYTLLTLCSCEFERAKVAEDRETLELIRTCLLAERSQCGNDEPKKVQQIEVLLSLIDKELQKWTTKGSS